MQFVLLWTVIALLIGNERSFARGQNVTNHATQLTKNTTSGNVSQGSFRYRIGNAISNQYREEHRDAKGVLRGSYGFRTPLGEFREVKYTADATGFRAHVTSNEPGISQQNPADVEVQKVSSQQFFDSPKLKQQLLVPGGYPPRNNLMRRGMLNPSTDNNQVLAPAVVHHAQLSTTEDKKGLSISHEDHLSIGHIQNEPKIPSDSLEVPLKGNALTSPWNQRDTDRHSAQLPFREKFLGDPQEVLPNILTLTPKMDGTQQSKNDFISSSVQHAGNPNSQQNKWVLGFIPFGIRADHIYDITKKVGSSLNSPESNDMPNPMFFDLKSPARPSSQSNKKNCKLDAMLNLGGKINQLLKDGAKESPAQNFKPSAFDLNNGDHRFQQQQGKQSQNVDKDIYLIQSIFAKRLAGILDSGGIFPPHLLPHSDRKESNKNPQLGIGPYQDIDSTQSKSEQWNTGHASQDIFEDKEQFDVTDTNLNSVQQWKHYPFSLRPISVSLSGKPISPGTQSHSQEVPPADELHFHKIGRRGESGQTSFLEVPEKAVTKFQNKEKSDGLIVRNFYDGKVYSTRIKTSDDQQDKSKKVNGDSTSNSFYENSDVDKGEIRTTLNSDPSSVLELPEWAGGHRLFEIPRSNRPLYDSKGVQIKAEDVPIHLHRFMPPKPQYPNGNNSFRFAIPRPVPPRSIIVPPKPPSML